MKDVRDMNESKKATSKLNTLSDLDDSCVNAESNFGGCTAPANRELIREGWQRRFVADQRMAKDAFESYTQLGYEVMLEPLGESALQDECSECQLLLKQFSVVYTRKLEKR